MGKGVKRKLILVGLALALLVFAALILFFGKARTSSSTKPPANQVSEGQVKTDSLPKTAKIPVSDPHMGEKDHSDELPAISQELAEEIRRLSRHNPEHFTETVNHDNSITMNTNGHFQHVTVGVRGDDGKIIIRHGTEFLHNIDEQ